MKHVLFLSLIVAIVSLSCGSLANTGFSKRTPHEKYSETVKKRPEGVAWVAASKKAFEHPQMIQLPYVHDGYFPADKPRSIGLQFSARKGERVRFRISKKLNTEQVIYADLFRIDATAQVHEFSAETSDEEFSIDVDETGSYLLRLQPELDLAASYSVAVSSGPSLDFPVPGNKARTGSFWGDSRDGGARKHEGIDIFAPKRTPVVAAEDGYINGVREGGLGGKTVWMRVKNRNISLYYAHLDEQLVQEGQIVQKGDTLGLIGNTGNAKTTPPHLHFGIYDSYGPVDPLPFVNLSKKPAPSVPVKDLTARLQLAKSLKSDDGNLMNANLALIPLAVTSTGYVAELPGGKIMLVPFSSVKVEKDLMKRS